MLAETVERILQRVNQNTQISSQGNPKDSQSSSLEKLKESCYKCDICRDTSWELFIDHTGTERARRCQCYEKEQVNRQWIASGLNPNCSNQTFLNFDEWNFWSRKAKETGIAYFRNFKEIKHQRRNSIMFCGQVGSGKIHISVAIALNLMKKGLGVVYMPYRDVITKLKQNIRDSEVYHRQLSKYQTCQVLLLDDIFKGQVSSWDINIIFEIINYRYLNYLPIIVSTEFTVETLLNFDEGIGSRIYEMCKDYTVEIEKAVENNYRLRA